MLNDCPDNKTMNTKALHPHPLISLLPLAVLIALIALVLRIFPDDALSGASQVALMVASSVCVALSMLVYKTKWTVFEEMIKKTVGDAGVSILILLLIGMMSATWMVSGVVPTMIYYGVQLMSPWLFLPCACIISSFISVITGTSWTTIATIGIALMGIGRAQGFDDGWVAGAIISGAYFGDKISPLSETTTLASGSLGVPLFSHIRYMLITTVPSITIALIIFAVGGFFCSTSSSQDIATFASSLGSRFNITPWLLLVPVLTGVMIARKVPPVITLFLSILLAVVFGLVFQTDAMREIDPSLFKAAMKSVYGSTALHSDNPMLADLVSTRGMAGMKPTIWLIICAMCFGGCMQAGGMVGGITRLFIHMVKGRTSLVGSTAASGVMLNVAIADQYLCILLTGNMFRDIYDREGYERRLLSRTAEDAVTVTSVLVPWNTCGMTQSTVLGVATVTYLPYCFFNIISPVMSVLVAALGYKIWRKADK